MNGGRMRADAPHLQLLHGPVSKWTNRLVNPCARIPKRLSRPPNSNPVTSHSSSPSPSLCSPDPCSMRLSMRAAHYFLGGEGQRFRNRSNPTSSQYHASSRGKASTHKQSEEHWFSKDHASKHALNVLGTNSVPQTQF